MPPRSRHDHIVPLHSRCSLVLRHFLDAANFNTTGTVYAMPSIADLEPIDAPRLVHVRARSRQLHTSSMPADAAKAACGTVDAVRCAFPVTAANVLATDSMQSRTSAPPVSRLGAASMQQASMPPAPCTY